MKNLNKQETIKIIVVLGPTASGKSDLAVRLAKEFDGEIISADSRQVYKGLNIGTGKITKREMAGVPHYLLDVAFPRRVFTAHEYAERARAAVSLIAERGKLPIICGGTAFYIDALLGDMPLAHVPPNQKLRKELEQKTTEALFAKLKKLDRKRTEKIDAENRRRLIRAIEIAETLGKVKSGNVLYTDDRPVYMTSAGQKERSYDALKIGLRLPNEELRKRIKKRLAARMKKGMVAEVLRLHEKGLSWERMESLGLEYRFLARYLQKKITHDEMLARLETEIWHYAKRQMTWWKRDKTIRWYAPDEYSANVQMITDFLGKKLRD